MIPHPNDVPVHQLKKTLPKVDLLPVFLEHPIDSFVIKSRPAILNCTVLHSSKAYFTCNGEALSKSKEHIEKNLVNGNENCVNMLCEITNYLCKCSWLHLKPDVQQMSNFF